TVQSGCSQSGQVRKSLPLPSLQELRLQYFASKVILVIVISIPHSHNEEEARRGVCENCIGQSFQCYETKGKSDTSSNHAVLKLAKGDEVWLRMGNGALHGDHQRFSTFAGFLLFETK
uniref:C1q domain-containing protein n=1 Tax=Felis catus TaxID=9685 RepID=A0ABI7Y023_FELCA